MTSEESTTDTVAAINGKRLHPAYLIIGAGRTLRAMIPLILLSIVQFPPWLLIPLGALVVVGAVLSWWRTKYSIHDGVLRVSSGILSRKVRTVHARRITAVETERGIVQRIFGVWGLKIQTPGDGDSAAVSLPCLSAAEAETVRNTLRSNTPAHTSTADLNPELAAAKSQPATEPLAALGTKELLITAVTGTSVPLIVAGLFTVWNRSRELLPGNWQDYLEHELFGRGRGTVIILVVIVLLSAAVGVLLTALRIANFTLQREEGRLRISRGLVSQRTGSIAVDRVQAVRLVDGFARRMIGYTSIEVEVAGLTGKDENQRTLFPLVKQSLAADLINRAIPELEWQPQPLLPIPRRAKRRYLTVPTLLGLSISLLLLWASITWWGFGWSLPGWLLTLDLLPIALPAAVGWARARDAGWALDEHTLVVRSRNILSRYTLVARRNRVQITTMSTNPFQRRADLASLKFDLSSGRSAELRHIEDDDAGRLLRLVGRRHPDVPAEHPGRVGAQCSAQVGAQCSAHPGAQGPAHGGAQCPAHGGAQ